MARRGGSLLVVAFVLALLAIQCQSQSQPEKKVTNLHFFLHDTLSGDNPTAVLVAGANLSSSTPFSAFGNVFVFDDPLTEGPELDSKLVGRAQGFYILSGQQTFALVMGADYVVAGGSYDGSSFVVFSKNPVSEKEREIAVVGGRGAFRMAEGVAKLRTYSLDEKTGDAVIEYNVTLLHDDDE